MYTNHYPEHYSIKKRDAQDSDFFVHFLEELRLRKFAFEIYLFYYIVNADRNPYLSEITCTGIITRLIQFI